MIYIRLLGIIPINEHDDDDDDDETQKAPPKKPIHVKTYKNNSSASP